MSLIPEITFRGRRPSKALEADVRKRVEKLDHFFPHIVTCRGGGEGSAILLTGVIHRLDR